MKMTNKKTGARKGKKRSELAQLMQEERVLSRRLEKVQGRIFTLDQRDVSALEFEHLLDEISAGLPKLPPLPADFSRDDIYSDHD